jgi:hypothetical protein
MYELIEAVRQTTNPLPSTSRPGQATKNNVRATRLSTALALPKLIYES